jgi:hypothetical protein
MLLFMDTLKMAIYSVHLWCVLLVIKTEYKTPTEKNYLVPKFFDCVKVQRKTCHAHFYREHVSNILVSGVYSRNSGRRRWPKRLILISLFCINSHWLRFDIGDHTYFLGSHFAFVPPSFQRWIMSAFIVDPFRVSPKWSNVLWPEVGKREVQDVWGR